MFDKIKGRFRHEISLNRVRDHITIREGTETLDLVVDSDANSIVSRLLKAQKTLNAVNGETTEDEREQAAHDLSDAIFGKQQTEKLFAFYNGDASCVVTICGMYFGDPKHGLGKIITKAQKKGK